MLAREKLGNDNERQVKGWEEVCFSKERIKALTEQRADASFELRADSANLQNLN